LQAGNFRIANTTSKNSTQTSQKNVNSQNVTITLNPNAQSIHYSS